MCTWNPGLILASTGWTVKPAIICGEVSHFRRSPHRAVFLVASRTGEEVFCGGRGMSGAMRRGTQRARIEWANFMQWQGRSTRNRHQQRKRIPRNLSVEIPESKEFYDTPSLKIGVGMVAVAIFAKLTMMYDESKEEERTERKARELAEAQEAGPQIVSPELWEHLQQLRPRTPFESSIARDNARIRNGDALTLEDVTDWATDVLTDALARKEESLSP